MRSRFLSVAWRPVVLCAALLFSQHASAATGKKVALMPPSYKNGDCFRDLFLHPDQWPVARSKIQTLSYGDWKVAYQFSDDQLRAWLPMIQQWGLRFVLETGSVKEWGPTGQECFNKDRRYWDRIISLGGKIDGLEMDESLTAVRRSIKKSDDYAADETANFVALVRKNYPNMTVGEVEPYPSISMADDIKWIDMLQSRLIAKTGRGMDSFRLDVNWVEFIHRKQKGNWSEVKQIEDACRSRHIPFALIYWAADLPQLTRLGFADDSTWYVSMMQMGNDYALVGGSPDEYYLESWINGPPQSVPETQDWTLTRSVVDFCNKFVK